MTEFDCLSPMRNPLAWPLACLVLTGCLLIPGVATADEATDDFNLAVGLYRRQRFDLAAETFGEFLQQHPDHPRAALATLYYGLSLSSLEKYAPAREQFQKYLVAEPDSSNAADARYRIAESSYYLKDYEAATTQFREYLEAHPDHSLNNWARLLLGDSLSARQQWQDAQQVLKDLLTDQPEPQLRADAAFSLARAYEGSGDVEQALNLYRRLASETSPAIAARALTRQAAVLFDQQQYRESAAAYDLVVERFADTDLARSAALNSGMAWYRAEDFQAAANRFQQVPADADYYPRAALMAGLSLRSLGQLDQARTQLEQASAAAADTALAAEILYRRAELEREAGQNAAAAQMFEDLADRWPQDERVPDSLFHAAELHLELGQLPTARTLLNRLGTDHTEAAAAPRVRILTGRILLTEGLPDQAVQELEQATGESAGSDDRTQVVGQYYLLRAYHESGRHQDTLQVMQRLQPRLEEPEYSHLRAALATAAISSLQLQQYADVQRYADQFLSTAADDRRAADVLAARAIAAASQQQFAAASSDVATLTEQFPDRPQTWTAILQSAEIAWKQDSYPAAAEFFAAAAERKQEPAIREAGLSGLAWSQYRQDQFQAAAETFGTLVSEFPESAAAVEAAFMQARSLQDAGNTDAAITAASDLFNKLRTASPPTEEASAAAFRRYLRDSGQLAARLLSQQERVEAADQIWEALATEFAAAADLDQLLDEWAFLNLTAGKFERSDQIYRQLLDQFPDSPLAGHARLSLAESEMAANRFDQAEREFQAIVDTPEYAESVRENALYHLIEIEAGRRNWQQVRTLGDSFIDKYPNSARAASVLLLHADALLNLGEYDRAWQELQPLRTAVLDEQLPTAEWMDRIWIVLAEIALADRRYQDIEPIANELQARSPESPYLFQMYDVQGRRWKSQAEPDFAKAREYFQKVIQHPVGRGTETAARCQYLIAETLLMQTSLEDHLRLAQREFYRVYVNYPYDEWRARGLYQAAGCEVELGLQQDAIRSYQDLIRDFPNSEFAARAREQLAALQGA